ncbi:hypothetical protein AX14_011188 [Amanita brunnescens Koide BX004]|nr:hypothetical protein AX14_011188 [Amanita brunnescens Koide BX004]
MNTHPLTLSDSSHLASPVRLPDSAVSSSAFFFTRELNSGVTPRALTSTTRRPHQLNPLFENYSHRHAFDSLPWITALDSTADALNSNPGDIADLSQLPLPRSSPTRRRPRSSVRVLSSNSDTVRSDILFETGVLKRPGYLPPSPSVTPPSLFDPTHTSFHDLMPIIDPTPHDMNAHRPTPPGTPLP